MAGSHSESPAGTPAGITRRDLLQGSAAAALGLAVLGRPVVARAVPSRAASLTGLAPLVAAMHVHASYSEGRPGAPASWDLQYAAAAAAGVDVLWQTDHDFRARARGYMTALRGTFIGSTTGAPAQKAATFATGGNIRLLVESSGAAPATQGLAMEETPTAVNNFRTGIDGQTITLGFGTSRLDAGALCEVVLTLAAHPAQGGRPAGEYSLRYRFARGASPRRFTEGGGLVGVVLAPMPANDATVTLNPLADIGALWPGMPAIDHCSTSLGFVVTSPRRGVVADVRLRAVTVNRVRHDAAGVLDAQRQIAATYSPRYGVTGIVSEEVSLGDPAVAHCNVFGSTPEFALKTGINATNWPAYYRDMIARTHSRGGVVSWNHPFGASQGPVLTVAEQVRARRQIFAARLADRFLGADVLEVGYALRGFVPFSAHLDLWDTFSRRAIWLTGNGASDDHVGQDWRTLVNGFLTGIWAASTGQSALAQALAGGRAYTFHPQFCPGLQLDTVVDGAVPMGQASVSSRTSRSMEIAGTAVPAGCTVELVRGPVDYAGQDPATAVVASFPASAFGGSGTGTVRVPVSTATSCFVRPQVRRDGILVAAGNPTWLLRSPPPAGIPAARRAG
jgi:hypothetical protein